MPENEPSRGRRKAKVGAGLLGLLLIVTLIAPALLRLWGVQRLHLGNDAQTGETRILGRVSQGTFRAIAPLDAVASEARYTAIAMQAAQSPESAELDLRVYEDQVIVIQGRFSGDWVYGSRVASTLGPWPTFLIRWAWLGR
jgi:hypothetical protein